MPRKTEQRSSLPKSCRRNPVARMVRAPQYHQRVVPLKTKVMPHCDTAQEVAEFVNGLQLKWTPDEWTEDDE